MSSPVAGWYPDPGGQPGERFWNGTGWTEQLRPTPAVPADPPQAWDGFGNPAAPAAPATPAAQQPYGTPPQQPYATPPQHAYGTPPQQPYGAPPPYATGQYATGSPAPRSFWSRNTLSLATVGVTVAYLLILVFAHFAILGILPLALGIRAIGRKEPLAIPAIVIGVLAFVVGIYEFAH